MLPDLAQTAQLEPDTLAPATDYCEEHHSFRSFTNVPNISIFPSDNNFAKIPDRDTSVIQGIHSVLSEFYLVGTDLVVEHSEGFGRVLSHRRVY